MIKAGWGVVGSDFDPVAFEHWRLGALESLIAMFGPDHIYTKHFEHFAGQGAGRIFMLQVECLLQPATRLREWNV